jgi:hypothetical protein
MMPPFPSLSPKFRKAGFPRSGFKASLSDRAFPSVREFLAALGLRPSFVLSASTVGFPVLCRRNVALEHRRSSSYRCSTPGALAPVRVIHVSVHHHLLAPSVPLAGTSRFRRIAAYT